MMETVETYLAIVGLTFKILVGGTLGSIIQLKFWTGLDWPSRITTVLCGVGLAWLATKPAIVFFKLSAQDYEFAVAGAIGVGGMAFIAGAWKTIREIDWRGMVEKAISRKLGGS